MAVTEFRIKPHKGRNCNICEIWVDGEFYATIYPFAHSPGIRIISLHVETIAMPDPMIFEFKFDEHGDSHADDFGEESGSTGHASKI